MPSLTGQQIQNTYDGLLKLANSTTGITSSIQAIQDGLGNNTGSRIATNFFQSPTTFGMNYLKADYYGVGVNATATAPVANTQNVINAMYFYDNGNFDYSAITFNIATATTSSDVWTCAFYTAQWVPNIGLAPATLIQSGITLTTNSTGLKTITLPSTLSFSGYGPGLFFWVWKLANAGVTPTVRPMGFNAAGQLTQVSYSSLGYTISAAGTGFQGLMKTTPITNPGATYPSLSNFQTSYSVADVSSPSTTIAMPTYGFVLNTIR